MLLMQLLLQVLAERERMHAQLLEAERQGQAAASSAELSEKARHQSS